MATRPVGRFAPSPTGPLHMGSLVTAVASYLDIKKRNGEWYIRIDNLDLPREKPTAAVDIITSLTAHGLTGDRPIDYQSEHSARYTACFNSLQDYIYYCTCTRKALAGLTVYPGHCRHRAEPSEFSAIRLRTPNRDLVHHDQILGHLEYNLGIDFGDLIIRRKDELWAYNFATAIDDGFDVTHVLRGQDLNHVTPQQTFVMELLKAHWPELSVPEYAHIPLLRYTDGTKLSKQTHAPPLDDERASENLRDAFFYLGLNPPQDRRWPVTQWLGWGQKHWDAKKIPDTLVPYKKTPPTD